MGGIRLQKVHALRLLMVFRVGILRNAEHICTNLLKLISSIIVEELKGPIFLLFKYCQITCVRGNKNFLESFVIILSHLCHTTLYDPYDFLFMCLNHRMFTFYIILRDNNCAVLIDPPTCTVVSQLHYFDSLDPKISERYLRRYHHLIFLAIVYNRGLKLD